MRPRRCRVAIGFNHPIVQSVWDFEEDIITTKNCNARNAINLFCLVLTRPPFSICLLIPEREQHYLDGNPPSETIECLSFIKKIGSIGVLDLLRERWPKSGLVQRPGRCFEWAPKEITGCRLCTIPSQLLTKIMPAVHAVVQVPPYTSNFVSPNTRYEVINGKATGIPVFHGPDKCLTNQWCSLNFRSGVRQLGYSFGHGEKGLLLQCRNFLNSWKSHFRTTWGYFRV